MTFYKTVVDEASLKKTRQDMVQYLLSNPSEIQHMIDVPLDQCDAEQLASIVDAIITDAMGEVYQNDVYNVVLRRLHPTDIAPFPMIHLSIRRLDRQAIHDWRDLQEIKNVLVGPEHEGVEIYPAESRLVDSANQYHLWVFALAKQRFPFGFFDRFVSNANIGNSQQRPLRE